jgi:predicted permease
MFRQLVSDLRFSLRLLRQQPVFSFAAVAVLTLGIGANSAIFSVVNSVLLKRLPYPNPDRIVTFTTVTPSGSIGGASPAKLNLWIEQPGAFDDVSGYRFRFSTLKTGSTAEEIAVGEVSVNFFRLFGASFERGRSFTADDQLPGAGHVAIVSAGFARRHLADPSNGVGRTVSIDRDTYLVVGFLKSDFDGETLAGPVEGNPDVWLPLQLESSSRDQANSLGAVARLVEGATLETGRSQLGPMTERFRQMFPGIIGQGDIFTVELLRDSMTREVRRSILILQGAVACVLLIACANVASLLLVQGNARAREVAVKVALGAGRGRIVRQLLTESVVLSMIGGLLGLALGSFGMRALSALYPGNLAWAGGAGPGVIDVKVLGFTILATVLTAVIAGLVPALHASRVDLNVMLKGSGGPSVAGSGPGLIRSTLVAGEIALAVVLLVGAALLARTFVALRAVTPGFDARGVLTLRMPAGDSPELIRSADIDQLVRNGIDRLGAMPGVQAAGASCCMPFENDMRLRFVIVGRPLQGPYHGMGSWRSVSPGYFDALRIPLVRGRLFDERDRLGAPGVVIVNQAMAHQLWADADPLTDSLIIGQGLGPAFASEPVRRIVGIVGDVRDAALDRDPRPTTYVPIAQLPDAVMAQTMGRLPVTWMVRTATSSAAQGRIIQDELERVSGRPIVNAQFLSEVMRGSTSDSDFYLTIMSSLGGAALMLAVIGLSGVMSSIVQQRTKEIGVRLALGAEGASVTHMIVLQGIRLTCAGITVGVAGAFALTRVMTRLLFGVTTHDPVAFLSVPLIVMLTALLATWIPARTVAHVDVMRALRCD